MTKIDHMIKVPSISFGICLPFPIARRFFYSCCTFSYLVEAILSKKQNKKSITCKNNSVRLLCFLTGNTYNYI